MTDKFDWEQKNTIRNTKSKIQDDVLPRVLILGDSISLGYTPHVIRILEGTACVTRPQTNCGPSQYYLKNDTLKNIWLEDGKWDVIHVNFGIWDNHYMTADGDILLQERYPKYFEYEDPMEKDRAIRADGGHIRTEPLQYAENMRKIFAILKATGAKVIFGLSTPLPRWRFDGRWQRIRAYNAIAEEVCRETGVQVNDLYAVADRHLNLQTDGCHFNEEGYRILAEAVASIIRENLPHISK